MGWAALNLKSVAAWKRELDTDRDDGCRLGRRALTLRTRRAWPQWGQRVSLHQPQSGYGPTSVACAR